MGDAIEIALTTQNSIVSDKFNSAKNITSGDLNVSKNLDVKDPLANESLSTIHSSMEISDTAGQETSEPQDLKKEIMGNTKSVQNAENLMANELLINIVNENIKKICLYPEYRSSDKTQSIIKQVLDLVVNTGDAKELYENINNEKLQVFLNLLSDADIKKLCLNSTLQNDSSDLIIAPQIQDKEELNKMSETKSKHNGIINENIRIVRKSPSYAHDHITQMSVLKVLEIIESTSNDEELLENLQDLSLEFFTEPEKSQFWLLKEENLDSCITVGNTQEPPSGIVDKYLIKNKGEIIDTNKPEKDKIANPPSKIEDKIEDLANIPKEENTSVNTEEDKKPLSDSEPEHKDL